VRRSHADRLGRLRSDTPRRWGTLTAHEMLCHLGDAAEMVLRTRPRRSPIPLRARPFVKAIDCGRRSRGRTASAVRSVTAAAPCRLDSGGPMRLPAAIALVVLAAVPAAAQPIDYRVLATNKTSTMEKELNEAAEAGFRFQQVMGGESAIGGKEVVVVMSRAGAERGRFAYRLLATSKTSTMQTELREASDAGFGYRGQTVFSSTFGGEEVVVILERDKDDPTPAFEFKLMATSKTSTLEKELGAAGAVGYEIVGMTVGKTATGGRELVAITRRPRR
jgi:hypothetical protein